MPLVEKDITKDNPFRPDGELRREVDELLRQSIITRNKCYIPNHTMSGNNQNTSDDYSSSYSMRPSLNNHRKTIPHTKLLSVHFSSSDTINPDIIVPEFINPPLEKIDENSDSDKYIYKKDKNGIEILIETTSMSKPRYVEKIKIPEKRYCCIIL